LFLLFKVLILPFIKISLLLVGVIAVIHIDVHYHHLIMQPFLENRLLESWLPLTEIIQGLLLLASAAIFIWSAIKEEESRTLFILVSGFFGCLLLRELDYYFDMIVHGFWFYPAILLASSVIIYSMKYTTYLISSARSFSQTNAYFNILVGLVIVLVFSRLFGSGTLWRDILNDDYITRYKDIIQEALESLGYMFLFIGSFHQFRSVKKN
jgi:hypothetical protein